MSSKLLKAQFNKMHTGAILIDKDSVSIFAGDLKNNLIDISSGGINIQVSPGKSIILNSLDIRGPLHKQSSIPFDFLPGFTNPTPRKELNIPLVDAAPDIIGVMSLYGAIASAGGL